MNLRKLVCLIVTSCCFHLVFSQKIYESNDLNEGVYMGREELLNNKPSEGIYYDIKRTNWRTKDWKRDTISTYELVMGENLKEKLGIVFGFCDGTNVYFNPEISRSGFIYKIKHLNRLAYYNGVEFTGNGRALVTGNIYNLETGELTRLNAKSMRYILINNKELLNKFDKESKGNKKNQEVLEQYYLELIKSMK